MSIEMAVDVSGQEELSSLSPMPEVPYRQQMLEYLEEKKRQEEEEVARGLDARSILIEQGHGVHKNDTLFALTPSGERLKKVIQLRQVIDNHTDPTVTFSMDEKLLRDAAIREGYLSHSLGLPADITDRRAVLAPMQDVFRLADHPVLREKDIRKARNTSLDNTSSV